MARTSLEYLADALEHMLVAGSFLRGMGFESFVEDKRTVFAVERAIEIVGEASRHIPDEVRARFPEIPWRDMSDMRNLVSHVYFDVDVGTVWDTATVDIPATIPLVQKALEILESEMGET